MCNACFDLCTNTKLLVHSFDSRNDGKTAILTPHTAFDDSSKPEGALKRESIELRLLVFYDE